MNFIYYSAVKYAYQEEVPLYKTEQEFWISYFQSEYYNRDKGGLSEAGNMLINRSRIDEIIYQYEQQKQAQNNVTNSNISNKIRIDNKKKIILPIDASIDLTSTYGDYRPSEILSQLLPYEDKETIPDKDTMQSRLAVVEKYNKHSSVLMQNVPGDLSIHGGSGNGNYLNKKEVNKSKMTTNEYEELIEQPTPHYLPLQLNHMNQTNIKGNVPSSLQHSNLNQNMSNVTTDIHEPSESAFGVSSFRKVTKTNTMLHLPQSIDIKTTTGTDELHHIKKSIHSVWPTADRAHMTNQNVIMPALREAWQLQQHQVKQFQSNIYSDVSDVLSKHNKDVSDNNGHNGVGNIQTPDHDHLFRKNQASFLVVRTTILIMYIYAFLALVLSFIKLPCY